MSFVTFLWSMTAAAALMLAGICAFAWQAERKDLAKLMFCVTAIATAAATPIELGMMKAATPSEYGEWLRWYHLPIFFTLVGQILFVHYYLGTGRSWLLWSFIPVRLFVLVANFAVDPNYNFEAISSLGRISFLGEPVSVIAAGTPRTWQWLATASNLVLVLFIVDATVQSWRKNENESRRKAWTVGMAMILPMTGNLLLNQLVVFGLIRVPIFATLWFLGALAVIAVELSRELIRNSRARLRLAELQSEWAQVERVNVLGHLASALAHELTQPISATRTNAEAARRYLRSATPDLGELRATLDDIHNDATRAALVIERMRSLIVRRTIEAQAFGLSEVAQDVLALLRHEAIAKRVDLRCRMPPDLPPASGDRVHISQVLLNLLTNAMEAVQCRPASARRVLLEAQTEGTKSIRITVSDTGPGIPDGRLEDIFNPLRTTKANGLGMGLALSRMIVDAHGGSLWAENGNGSGAVFHFTLPLASNAVSSPLSEKPRLDVPAEELNPKFERKRMDGERSNVAAHPTDRPRHRPGVWR